MVEKPLTTGGKKNVGRTNRPLTGWERLKKRLNCDFVVVVDLRRLRNFSGRVTGGGGEQSKSRR